MTPPVVALTREISPALVHCELTHLPRQPIDLALAVAQHHQYEEQLGLLGCRVQRVPAPPNFPDAVFIEDTAIVLDEIAIIARPGAESRRAEVAAVAAVLASHRPLARIEPPGTLDGGDVLTIGRTIYVGRTSRTNENGCEQLARYVEPFRYAVQPVAVHGCLHLKSAATAVGAGTILVNAHWLDLRAFDEYELINVHPEEPCGANALRIGDRVIHAAAFPRTRRRLERHGIEVVPVDASELAKAEGGVTCCSLVFAEMASVPLIVSRD